MAKRLDHSAHHFRKRAAPLVSKGEAKAYRQEGEWLAARIAKGRKSANASRSSPVRILTAEDRKTIEDRLRAEGRL